MNGHRDRLHELAMQFHRLHDTTLVLPNAWDPASALIIERAGASAIATTSAGVAWSRAVPDGGGLDRQTAADALARLTSVVSVPVTADIESAYAEEAGGVVATVEAVIDAGAVGVNIEDSREGRLVDVKEQSTVLTDARATAENSGIPVFVNARLDTYMFGADGIESADLLEESVQRARAYVAAGAHGVFVPGLADAEAIAAIVAAVDAPINVMVGAGSPSVAELAGLGVRRISLGPQLALSAYGMVGEWASHVLRHGEFTHLPAGVSFADLNMAAARRMSS